MGTAESSWEVLVGHHDSLPLAVTPAHPLLHIHAPAGWAGIASGQALLGCGQCGLALKGSRNWPPVASQQNESQCFFQKMLLHKWERKIDRAFQTVALN